MDKTIIDLMAFALGESDLEQDLQMDVEDSNFEEGARFALSDENPNLGLMTSEIAHPPIPPSPSFSSSLGDFSFLALDSSIFSLDSKEISKCLSATPTANGTALNETTTLNVSQFALSETNVFVEEGSLRASLPSTAIPLSADDSSTIGQQDFSAQSTPQLPPANNLKKRGRKPKPKDGTIGNKPLKTRKKYMLPPTDPNYHAKDVKNARQAKFNRDQKKQLYVNTANENANLKETIAAKDELIIQLQEHLVQERGLRRAMQDNLSTIKAAFAQNYDQLKSFKILLDSSSNGENKSDQKDVVS
ncbi:uncharacterized protein LOC110861488 isoform X1 [Folsomia candida]|uniref:Uncharacterized protein n=1 Tax=Folsomia candida TaxID=158441 RepID=A0A226D132_FOLCA|nr:uncharacterized protein LOC110861488 isoform X1 [Folsomia candida]XP_035700648.1 uncharacterized protein LOC110861488 isoform X1 [Folsomia candida]OXA38919.1 hypothetical protein Fcan01_26248 [Folsomia candida]